MQLLTIQDPRDNLEKARKNELVDFAHDHRIAGVDPAMPAILIRKILRSRGHVDITVPVRLLGQTPGARGSSGPSTPENTVEMLADDDLMQQWLRSQGVETPTVPDVPHANGHAHDYSNEVDRIREGAERAIREGQAILLSLKVDKNWTNETELPSGVQDLEALEPKNLPIDSMKMPELRKACKAAGIKMKRTDKMLDLRAKLNGENTSECSQ